MQGIPKRHNGLECNGTDKGAVKYQVVSIAKLINDRLVSQNITDPFSFPQVVKGGVLGFFIARKNIEQSAEVGFVKGVVKGQDGKPISGAVVSISSLPFFISKTNAKGEYLVPSIVGNFWVTALDPNTGKFQGGGVIIDI